MTRLLRLVVWFGLAAVLLTGVAARAESFSLPGVESDSEAYARALTARVPAGGSTQARRQADQRIADAQRRNDAAALVSALETRISLGDPTADMWLALARAQLRRAPPDAAHALAAAWQNFSAVDEGAPEIPSLLVMAEALRVMDRPVQAISTLEAVLERAPDDAGYKRMLADARRAAGLLERAVRTEVESEPPRACIAFTSAPSRRNDFVPGDWVRLDPPTPDAAVTREGDQLCVSGLRLGQTTRIILRQGLPGEDGLTLIHETTLPVAMGNRAPRLFFDSRVFLLPRDQDARITLGSVNLSSVKLRIVRLSERTIVPWVRDHQLGTDVERYTTYELDQNARPVWSGKADIAHWQPNQITGTALPLPDVFGASGGGPGLYAVIAETGDGTPNADASATQMILRTDLAPTVWRGADGLTVQVRGFSDAHPRAGVDVQLLAHNNDILQTARTDGDGVVRFGRPLLQGEGPLAPATIHAMTDTDFVVLDLNTAAFNLSDRGVEGLPHPGPLDAFVWTDRGIYRPGETVQVMALVRDAAGQPADLAVHVRVKRPNGQVLVDSVPARLAEGSVHVPVTISQTAAFGTWTIEVLGDPKRPAIGTASFRVDSFVPDRMAVELGTAPGSIVAGTPFRLPVSARFLYGAPAAGLTGTTETRLVVDPAPGGALTGYRVGLERDTFAPDTISAPLPDTDAQGHSTFELRLPRAPDTTHPVKADITINVDDPSGHSVHAHTTVPVRPAGRLIGIKPDFDGSVDANAEAGFEVIGVSPDGARVAIAAKLRLVRERPDWRMVTRGTVSRYEIVYRDEPLETRDVQLSAEAPFHYSRKLDFGTYRIEVLEASGLAATSVRFRSGWVASESADVPDKVDVSVDKRSFQPGETARVHIAAPFGGEGELLVVTDHVHSLRSLPIPDGGTEVDVPVEAGWGPGAYVVVHVFRPGGGNGRPGRAIGLAWMGVDPASRKIDVAFQTPEKIPPRGRFAVPIKTAPGAWVSLAAVDEGILRLTDFESPDPTDHFTGRRTMALDIRDDWGRLIRPAEGEATVLSQGGDEGGGALREIPQKTVILFVPPVQADSDGNLSIPLDIPDFAGQVRLMAVAWSGTRIGAGHTDVFVRDPMIAEPLLPRFLSPGDETRMAVLLQNLDLPPGEATVGVSVEGPLAVSGTNRLAATLAVNQQVVQTTTLKATGTGRGIIRLDIRGPGGFAVQRETAILIRPARPATTTIAGTEIAPNGESRIATPTDRFVAGSFAASLRFGGPVRYDTAALVRSLRDYPFLCLEQATSRGFPLAMLPDGPLAGPDRASTLQSMVTTVLDRQRYDGGFGLWSANGPAQAWLSSYATEFLLRAKAAGAAVPESALADALKFIADAADSAEDGDAEKTADQVYRLYVLAMAGQPRAGANRVMFQKLDGLPTPLARAQLGAALARSNDRPRAELAFAAALAGGARRAWYHDYGTALRDQLAVAMLVKESGLVPDQLARFLTSLPGADLNPDALSTQEQAWAIAAAAVLGRDGRMTRVAVDGRPVDPAPIVVLPLTGPVAARNLDDRPVWQTVSVTGVLTTAPPAARNQMRITRKFFTADGATLDLDHLRQNTVFVILLEGRAEDGQQHQALVTQGLPAGWEITGRFGSGKVAGMPWLGELSDTDSQPSGDDRFAAVLSLSDDSQTFRVAVRVRAVTPGDYELPGAQASDMYRPGVFARQNTGRIKVLATE